VRPAGSAAAGASGHGHGCRGTLWQRSGAPGVSSSERRSRVPGEVAAASSSAFSSRAAGRRAGARCAPVYNPAWPSGCVKWRSHGRWRSRRRAQCEIRAAGLGAHAALQRARVLFRFKGAARRTAGAAGPYGFRGTRQDDRGRRRRMSRAHGSGSSSPAARRSCSKGEFQRGALGAVSIPTGCASLWASPPHYALQFPVMVPMWMFPLRSSAAMLSSSSFGARSSARCCWRSC